MLTHRGQAEQSVCLVVGLLYAAHPQAERPSGAARQRKSYACIPHALGLPPAGCIMSAEERLENDNELQAQLRT